MNRREAEASLKTLLWNATELMRRRREKTNLVDKILVYPVDIVEIHILGSYLKEAEHPKDLDVIALYKHNSDEEIKTLAELGRIDTYRTAKRKLLNGTTFVDLQLYEKGVFNYTINPFIPNSPPIDRIKKVWDIGNIE